MLPQSPESEHVECKLPYLTSNMSHIASEYTWVDSAVRIEDNYHYERGWEKSKIYSYVIALLNLCQFNTNNFCHFVDMIHTKCILSNLQCSFILRSYIM